MQEWFQKPVRIASGDLTSTDDATTFSLMAHPNIVLDFPVYSDKWKGYSYWRGDITYRLQVNATGFQAGLYSLCYIPSPGVDSILAGDWVDAHYNSPQQRSQLPQAVIDINEQTSVSLTVPYAHAYDKIPLVYPTIDTYATMGRIRLFPISPVATGAGQITSAGYTLWATMDNVHLEVPAYPQSSLRSKKKMPSEQEQKMAKAGPVESTARILAKAASILATVPLLSTVAAPAAWALELSAGVAGVFGWSKPNDVSKPQPMQKDLMWHAHHVDGVDSGAVLSLRSDNTVEVLPGFAGTDIDELSFDVFLSRPTFTRGEPWTTAQAVGTQIFAESIGPNNWHDRIQNGITVRHHTPMSLLASHFAYWRGDIIYKVKIVKTRNHSGRLVFHFTPFCDTHSTAVVSLDNSVFEWREVVDIRDVDEITLTIPFHNFKPYRPTTHDTSELGRLTCHVLDELVCPNTCSLSVDVLGYTYAAPGFEFAVPKLFNDIPIYKLDIIATPQSGEMGTNHVNKMIGNAIETKHTDNIHARMCIGERIMSIRQLLRRTTVKSSISSYVRGTNTDVFSYNPFTLATANHIASFPLFPLYCGDALSTFGSMFALSRGGVRVKFNTFSTGIEQTWIHLEESGTQYAHYETTIATDEINLGKMSNAIYAVNSTADRNGIEVTVPAYGTTSSRGNAACIEQPLTTLYMEQSLPPIYLKNKASQSRRIDISTAGADDYNLGLFVSIPPMVHIDHATE